MRPATAEFDPLSGDLVPSAPAAPRGHSAQRPPAAWGRPFSPRRFAVPYAGVSALSRSKPVEADWVHRFAPTYFVRLWIFACVWPFHSNPRKTAGTALAEQKSLSTSRPTAPLTGHDLARRHMANFSRNSYRTARSTLVRHHSSRRWSTS